MPVGSNLLTLLSSSSHLRHLTVLRLARYARHPAAAFSSAAASHGRLHFAFTRPSFVFWSRVANQFHADATVTEESGEASTSFSVSDNSRPWPEWSKLSGLLVEKSYSDRFISSGEDDDSFLVDDDLPEEFLRSAKACLGFARDRPDILRLLTKKNIEAVVLNGSPFLFKNGENSSRRMKLFFNGEGSSELELEKAETVDVMRYLLSYVYCSVFSSGVNVSNSVELVEKSVRKLLGELYNLSGTVCKSKSVDADLMEIPSSNGQFSTSSGQDIEMKTINSNYTMFVAPSFIPSESRSSRPSNIIDAEYRRSPINQKQGPEEAPVDRTYGGYNNNSSSMNMNHGSCLNTLRSNFDANPAESSTDNVEYIGKPNPQSDNLWRNSNTTADRSVANSFFPHEKSWSAQHTYDSTHNANSTPSAKSSTAFYGGPMATSPPSRPSADNYSYHRDDINSTPPSNNTYSFMYGRPTSSSSQPLGNSWDNATNSSRVARDPWSGNTVNSTPPSSNPWDNNSRSIDYRGNYNTQYDGFVTKSTQTSSNPGSSGYTSYHGFKENSTQPSGNSSNSRKTSFGASSSENSPQPLPDSWNSYTAFSSQPPANSTNNYNAGPKISTEPIRNPRNTNNFYPRSAQDAYQGYAENSSHPLSNSWNSSPTAYSGGPISNPAHPSDKNSWNTAGESWVGEYPGANTQKNASYGYSGKSLEGSCVTEPDPLDMSEEAKAERWFRRAAQIKDISELSQIPDEDFPQIMPMRKGVNRFVVSKRKTPLERRLASQNYRRNLPVELVKEPAVGESTANDGSDSGL